MARSGTADLTLHGGHVPPWLLGRMKRLALPMVEAVIQEHGKEGFVERMANPFWFQSFGTVIGMDWNSSGVTTTVLNVLKQVINPVSKQLGVYVCGGKGKHSLKTPQELLDVGMRTGLDGNHLAHCSKLSAKVDNTAVQDGFQLYIHNFLATDTGAWSVVQQGMNGATGRARRYHWYSGAMTNFVKEPHTAVCGENRGKILNLVHEKAEVTQKATLEKDIEHPDKILKGLPHLIVPSYHEIRAKDIDLKRLGSVLWLAQENETQAFEDLLLLKGLGPRTLQSLTLVSELIYGTPSRFSDPARFAFAHGGKDGTPFPVPTKVYDQTIGAMKTAVEQARIGDKDKMQAIKKLSEMAQQAERNFAPNNNFDELVQKEKDKSHLYGGRTVFGWAKPTKNRQLNLFDTNEDATASA